MGAGREARESERQPESREVAEAQAALRRMSFAADMPADPFQADALANIQRQATDNINVLAAQKISGITVDDAMAALDTRAGDSLKDIKKQLQSILRDLQSRSSKAEAAGKNFRATSFMVDVQQAKAKVEDWKNSGVMTAEQLSVLDSVSAALDRYEAAFMETPVYRRAPAAKSEDIKALDAQKNFIGKAAVIGVGGVVGSILLYMAHKNKGTPLPGILFLAAAGAAAYGPSKLLAKGGDRLVQEVGFLADPKQDYAALIKKRGIQGEEWARVVEDLQGNTTAVNRYISKRKSGKATEEDKAALLDTLASASPSLRPALEDMAQDPKDFGTFLSLVRQASSREAKQFVLEFIRKGAGNPGNWNLG